MKRTDNKTEVRETEKIKEKIPQNVVIPEGRIKKKDRNFLYSDVTSDMSIKGEDGIM